MTMKIELVALLILVLAGAGLWLHKKVYNEGIEAQRTADAKDREGQLRKKEEEEEKNRKKYEAGQLAWEKERAKLSADINAHPGVDARLCFFKIPSAVHTDTLPTAAKGDSAPGGGVPPGGAVYTQGPNIGPTIDVLTRIADGIVTDCRRQQAQLPPQ